MLLPEFFYLDINNWYLAPLLQTAGTIREITRLTVVDGFGVATNIGPSTGTGDPEWAMFSLAQAHAQAPHDGGGAFLYVPNIAMGVLDNDEVEEVLFTRDEEANVVWASERLVTLADGTSIRNGDDATPVSPEFNDRPASAVQASLRCSCVFRSLRSSLSRSLCNVGRNLFAPRAHGGNGEHCYTAIQESHHRRNRGG